MTVFARKLQELLEDKGIQQKELARAIDITEVTISRYINEDRDPQVAILEKIAEFFSVSTDFLLGRDKDNNTNSLDKQLEGLESALLCEVKELSEAQKKDILDYVRFKKNQKSE